MTILPILIAPHPILRKKATKVQHFDDALKTLIENMFETMYHAPGIGIAAPQVGVSKRLMVMDCAQKTSEHEIAQAQPDPRILINPIVLEKSGEDSPYDEGCLSLPGYQVPVEREYSATVRYQDVHGNHHNITFEGLPARCVLHEIDHLDGVMIIDYTSRLTRSRILRELRAQKKSAETQSSLA
ncbi:MAG: peptide deformylase [Alphaproteobacteria bacterium]|nr:peptide deformylase [Alphaproteobacteria bacterium]